MHISLHCACLICDKKNRRKDESNQSTEMIKRNPSDIRKSQENKLKTALQQASDHGSLVKPKNLNDSDTIDMEDNNNLGRSRSLARLQAQKDFLKATSLAADTTFQTQDSIPDLDEAFSKFLTMYPKYKSSEMIDQLRVDEYSHLADNDSKVCLDYCGFGLFSFHQIIHYWESCAINLSQITSNLSNHALYGGREKGTVENDIRTRIMDYLNIPESEYGLVFTVSRGSAFQLLAESYPFHTNKKLLTMFDHESQSVNWMAQSAKDKGAKVHSAWFKWPTLKPCSTHLKKQILNKKRRKKDSSNGLFVFPVQSRVTGAKYSYQWMSFAKQNNWHVLLDAGALGPLDMDSLGLSLFRPDFIITSFYRVFGYDPTGFGCLLIKKSVIGSLRKQSSHTSSGIVKISPVIPSYSSDSMAGIPQLGRIQDDEVDEKDEENNTGIRLPAFSGPLTPSEVRDVYETEMEHGNSTDRDIGSPVFEENEMFSDVLKSPVITEEDESPEDSMWIDLGQSPFGLRPVSHLPPPPWFTRKNRNNKKPDHLKPHKTKILSSNNFEVKPQNSPEIQEESEIESSSAIRRETEGEFMLQGRRVSFDLKDKDDYYISDEEYREPEVTCRHLDHINMLGLNKTTFRLRFLINWLVTSLLQLRLPPGSNTEEDAVPLVHIYGPKIKYERGASIAFNIRDRIMGVISPELVQKMGEINGISVGIGIISHVKIIQSKKQLNMDVGDTTVCRPMEKKEDGGGLVRAEVVTVSLGFLTNFEDVYKLWVFVAKFLHPSFIREYHGLSIVNEGKES